MVFATGILLAFPLLAAGAGLLFDLRRLDKGLDGDTVATGETEAVGDSDSAAAAFRRERRGLAVGEGDALLSAAGVGVQSRARNCYCRLILHLCSIVASKSSDGGAGEVSGLSLRV